MDSRTLDTECLSLGFCQSRPWNNDSCESSLFSWWFQEILGEKVRKGNRNHKIENKGHHIPTVGNQSLIPLRSSQAWFLGRCFSRTAVHENHLGILWKSTFWFSRFGGGGLRLCISYTFPEEKTVAVPQNTLWRFDGFLLIYHKISPNFHIKFTQFLMSTAFITYH